ncbi:hypothetical protein NL108_009074 [Boleophthalmus pectinirostris]|nr:hypothetical protein NL108_009074 [Boleophthalmus pectinirostris]
MVPLQYPITQEHPRDPSTCPITQIMGRCNKRRCRANRWPVRSHAEMRLTERRRHRIQIIFTLFCLLIFNVHVKPKSSLVFLVNASLLFPNPCIAIVNLTLECFERLSFSR